MVAVELVLVVLVCAAVAVSIGGSAESVFMVSYIVCSFICWSVSGSPVFSVKGCSLSDSNSLSSCVRSYVSMVLNFGL